MKTEKFNGSQLKEQEAKLPDVSAGVKDNEVNKCTPKTEAIYGSFGDTKQQFYGIIYRRWLNKPDSPDNGKSYVGETTDEAARKRAWSKPNSEEYGGAKILAARNTYGLLCWGFEILEYVYAASKEGLKKLLYERETYYIEKYDSYDNGFNGNRGGTGNTGIVFDEARRKQNGNNRRGRPQSEETKAILRKKSTGRIKSAEERAKISKGNTGKKRTDKMRQAQSKRMKGIEPKAASDAAKLWREKNGGGVWKGKKLPPDAIAKRNETIRKESQRIKVVAPDGTKSYFLCQTDAAKATGLKDGSIKYALDKNNGLHTKSGYKFVKISDLEYQNHQPIP